MGKMDQEGEGGGRQRELFATFIRVSREGLAKKGNLSEDSRRLGMSPLSR